jgi:hypothetical protein
MDMAETFTIEKNVPHAVAVRTTYPFAKMDVGDSFFVPYGPDTEKIISAASYSGKRNGRKFSIRKTDGGKRVWRVL